jgi:ribosomal protein S18 acetylase RimI-like enzyme
MVLRIYQAMPDADDDLVRVLFREYLDWAVPLVNREFGVGFEIDALLEGDMAGLDKFLPPRGRLLLAEHGGHVAGLGCMRQIRDGVGEIKRMYVRPQFRRLGIGRALAEGLIAEARAMGHRQVWLDSPRSWTAAHALYRSLGFEEIEPYAESEIPPDFWPHWIFMALPLE